MELSKRTEVDTARMREVSGWWIRQGSPRSLLATLHARLAGWISPDPFDIKRRALFLFASDSALMEEGGLSSARDSTAESVRQLAQGRHPANRLARLTGTQLVTVNMGTRGLDPIEGVIHVPVMAEGSRNIALEDALTEEAMMSAIRAGMELASQARARDMTLFAADGVAESGKLAATAMLEVFFDRKPEDLMARDSRQTEHLFERRAYVLSAAVIQRAPDRHNTLDVLKKLGSMELAAMTGFFAGAALYGIPVLTGSTVSLTAALTLVRLIPETRPLFFATHQPSDPGGGLAQRELGMTPVIDDVIPGSGEGSALYLTPLLDLTCALYNEFRDTASTESF